jgi:hypothetical protein
VTRPTVTGKLSHWPVQEIDDQNTPRGKSNIEREEGHKQKTHKNFENERKAERTNKENFDMRILETIFKGAYHSSKLKSSPPSSFRALVLVHQHQRDTLGLAANIKRGTNKKIPRWELQ